ncbi:uncharacterized protein FYW61_011840 [Anableps anableps]
MKFFEKLVRSHITSCLPFTLDPHQFASRTNWCTADAIATTLHTTLTHVEQRGSYIRLLFLDFSSAFNTIILSRLVSKLGDLGLPHIICCWIMDYFTDCSKRVRVRSHLSTALSTRVDMKAEDVLKALDDLSQEELKRFKWFLQQPEILPGLPAIKKAYLEKTESLVIVDAMVHTFTLQRCMEVTSTILEKINRNDLLQRLSEQRKKDNEVQEMIEKRQMKIQEIKELMKTSRDAADKEKAEGVLVIAALKESAERSLKEFTKEIEDKQKTTDKEAEDFIKDLEQEISELMKKSSEVDCHQGFSSLKDEPANKNWVENRVHPPSYEGTVERAVAQMKETLWEEMEKQLKLKKFQQFAVDVTLDPDTAHPALILSDDRKQVKVGNVWQNLPDNPKRFIMFTNVLAEQGFSSGRFYFEVQVKGLTDWDLGVARGSVDRKGDITLGIAHGFWTVILRNGQDYSTGENPSFLFPLHPGPEKVGVFVDYKEGLVSFYDVNAAALIYSFTGCCFTEKLYPFFSPFLNQDGRNSAPLIICPVNQADCCSDEAP